MRRRFLIVCGGSSTSFSSCEFLGPRQIASSAFGALIFPEALPKLDFSCAITGPVIAGQFLIRIFTAAPLEPLRIAFPFSPGGEIDIVC